MRHFSIIIWRNMETNTPLPQGWNHREWGSIFGMASKDWQETKSPNKLDFTATAPTLLNFIADWHIGHPSTHYDRITQEVEVIAKKRNSFAVLLGDMIDNMNWNPGQFEQIGQAPEQILYFRSLLQFLADKRSLLLYVQGDHDGWLMKAGYDPKQEAIARGVHGTNGPTQMTVKYKDGEKRIGVAHQLPGHSVYNPNHPQVRAEREIFRGADVIVSGHNHRKGNQRIYPNEWEGARPMDLIALGPYKPTDSWLAKKGFKVQEPEQMYGTAITINPGRGEIYVLDDIVKANK